LLLSSGRPDLKKASETEKQSGEESSFLQPGSLHKKSDILLFKGLYIYDNIEWNKFPVIYIDFMTEKGELILIKIKYLLELLYRHRFLLYRCIFLLLIGSIIIFTVNFITQVMLKWEI